MVKERQLIPPKPIIGAHSTIGANVLLMQSIAPYSLVLYEKKQLSILDKRTPEYDGPEYSI